jgi:2'-5' RNA ligase
MNPLSAEPTARMFVACDLPRPVDEAVRNWQSAALSERPGLRLADSLHITLCFLGEVARERGAEIVAALTSIAVPAIQVTLGGVVFLPEHGRKHVIAVLVDDPSHELLRVQADVSEALAGRGLHKPEQRAYLPHLTVARFRRPSHPFALQNVNVGQFCLSELILYTSVLERGGAVHTPLAVFPAK